MRKQFPWPPPAPVRQKGAVGRKGGCQRGDLKSNGAATGTTKSSWSEEVAAEGKLELAVSPRPASGQDGLMKSE